MRVPCPTCPRVVHAATEPQGRALLAAVHVCGHAVDPDQDPRRPVNDAHAERMEADRLIRFREGDPTP